MIMYVHILILMDIVLKNVYVALLS